MSDIKDKLKDLLDKKGLMTGTEWQQRRTVTEETRQTGGFEVEQVIDGEIIGEPDDGFFLVRSEFPLDFMQGDVPLRAALDAAPGHAALAGADPELEEFDVRTAVFVDAETTGLSGGTGTVAFLVGAGYIDGDVFRLDQCFMRDFDDEEPMLNYLGDVFKRAETIVSYNGKSFDVPLLRTRFITNRIPFRLDALNHYDLVHAARRFWKLRLQQCNLGNIEQHILGIERVGDIPGAEIPERWFEYLRTRDARPLKPVFYHHQMDIVSLVALVGRLAQCVGGEEAPTPEHTEDQFSIVRIHYQQKRYDEVIQLGDTFLERNDIPRHLLLECLEMLGYAHKRRENWLRMEAIWIRMMNEFPRASLPRIELAKHHEHRTRNLTEAERICREMLQLLETRTALGRAASLPPHYADFKRRLERIQKKLKR